MTNTPETPKAGGVDAAPEGRLMSAERDDTPTGCRRCSVCEGQEHHWDYYGDEDEAGEPLMGCKHCDATRPCADGDLEEDEDDGCCPGCGACPGFIGAECDEECEWAAADHNQPVGDLP